MPEGAGTGMVLTSDGEVLTNNHVVQGAWKISVKVPDGSSYTATVVGVDPAHDVALIQLPERLEPRDDHPRRLRVRLGRRPRGGDRQRPRQGRHPRRRDRLGHRPGSLDHRERPERQLREAHRHDPDERAHPARRLRRRARERRRPGGRHDHRRQRHADHVGFRGRASGSRSRSRPRSTWSTRSTPVAAAPS